MGEESLFQRLRRKNSFKYGLPFMLFLFIGSHGVSYFASLRYEFRRNELLKKENLAKLGIEKKKITLEEEYEKVKQLDLDSWENIRGPRPWEEPQPNQQKKDICNSHLLITISVIVLILFLLIVSSFPSALKTTVLLWLWVAMV